MIGLFGLFKNKDQHPLSKEAEVTKILAELPAEDPAQSLDEITHWLLTLASEDNLKLKDRVTRLARLDLSAQRFERKLRQQYVESSRLNKTLEERIWTANAEFLEATINAHLRCITDLLNQNSPANQQDLAIIAMRAMRRLDSQALWGYFRYDPVSTDIWEKVFSLIKVTEECQLMDLPVTLNSTTQTQTTVKREMLKLFMLSVSTPEQLTKLQIDLAHQLTHNLANAFVWENIPGNSTVFHIDISTPRPPSRLTKTSEHHFMFRCFGPGEAIRALITSLKQVEQGAIPGLLHLADPTLYRREDLLEVLAHLSQRWNRLNPTQEHQHFDKRRSERQQMFSRITIVHDFNLLHEKLSKLPSIKSPVASPTLSDNVAYREQIDLKIYGFITAKTKEQIKRMQQMRVTPLEKHDNSETWVVENISKMGYGVTISSLKEDWLKPNIVIGIHSDAAGWQIGIIRRLISESVENTQVGVQLLSNQPLGAMLRPADTELSVWETSADTQTYHHTPAILLPREMTLQQEDCLLMPPESYHLHKIYEMVVGEMKRIVRLVDRVHGYQGLDKIVFDDITHSRVNPFL